jgi:hypothetical protein
MQTVEKLKKYGRHGPDQINIKMWVMKFDTKKSRLEFADVIE